MYVFLKAIWTRKIVTIKCTLTHTAIGYKNKPPESFIGIFMSSSNTYLICISDVLSGSILQIQWFKNKRSFLLLWTLHFIDED